MLMQTNGLLPEISIIIPVLNEAAVIGNLVSYLYQFATKPVEIIVVDGGSTDGTENIAKAAGATVVACSIKSRAAQMHAGASVAAASILYFVHADTLPPTSYIQDIVEATKQGFSIGRYQTKFNNNSWLLRVNAFFTRFDLFVCMGGDQTLFVTKNLYTKVGGFNTSLSIMEEYSFCEKARKHGRYIIFSKKALVSARKYQQNSWWKVQKANYAIVKMYKKGATQQAMQQAYKQMLQLP